ERVPANEGSGTRARVQGRGASESVRAKQNNCRRGLAAFLSTAALLLLGAPVWADPPDRPDRAREADSLRRAALEWRAVGTWDARRKAMAQLERASLLAPHDDRVWLELGRMCCEAGERRRGRGCYERARRLMPDDAESHALFGMAWTWEWLNSYEGPPLARAVQEYQRACELDPGRAATWGALTALLLSRDRLEEAERA